MKTIFLTLALSLHGLVATAAEITPDRQKELTRFVRQECGFCHGLRLTGGLGSSLAAEVMQTVPAESLSATILYGRPGTAMPGWAKYLSEPDVTWIVEQLQKGFPDEKR
jgi:cytochrome c55X